MQIPDLIQLGVDQLRASRVCEVRGDLKQLGCGINTLRCAFATPRDNPAGLPAEIELELFFTKDFPFGSIDVYPASGSDEPRGFPHQDAESSKLCLPFKDDASFDEHRLVAVAEWAKEWLNDAANGTLLAKGDPYELPDFSCKRVKSPLLDKRFTLLIDETPANFDCWSKRVGTWGTAELRSRHGAMEMAALRFSTADGDLIRETGFSADRLFPPSQAIKATWALLPTVIVGRHRAAQTFRELREVFHRAGISLEAVVKKAWQFGDDRNPCSIVLVGFPIPRNVGEASAEVHWQPIVVPTPRQSKRAVSRAHRKRLRGANLWPHEWKRGSLRDNSPVVWARTENIARDRQFARGAHAQRVRDERISIVGCGAIGAPVAESLARGGVSKLELYDAQSVEYGNLCRHTLDGRHVGLNKAIGLAHRLASCHPMSEIRGHAKSLPFPAIDRQDRSAIRALNDSSTIIDCSTDEGAFHWLSRRARANGQRLASMFINANATTLTLVLSGKQTAAAKVYRQLLNDIEASNTVVCPTEYFDELSEEDSVLPVGCWQPTFPGLNSHIWVLAFAAIEHFSNWISDHWGCDGYGILIRRNSIGQTGPLVETVWNKAYR
ncbi:MAG: ThiF family adenylyltransferase [Aureliella sp.]